MYSIIVNANTSAVPDILNQFYDFIFEQLLLNPATHQPRTPSFRKFLNQTESGIYAANFPRFAKYV